MTTLREAATQAQELILAQQKWIQAVPDNTPLPTMPGHDGDWAWLVTEKLRQALAQPESEPSDRADLIAKLRADFNEDRVDFDNIKAAANMLEADAQQAPIAFLPAYELDRLKSGHGANVRSAKFGPSHLDGDVPVYLKGRP